ncbi:MAG: L-histidine N(alpha)-methyltransferase [bacterium]
MRSAFQPTGLCKSQATFDFHDYHPALDDFYGEVMEGLGKTPKAIPPKFFYDERGSDLFFAITKVPEYYLTRTEVALLELITPELADLLERGCNLIEYGCGSSRKIRILLDALYQPSAYLAIDISKEHLLDLCRSLGSRYSNLAIKAICADFTRALKLPIDSRERNVAFFPGSSIGNFEPAEALLFLRNVKQSVGRGGGMIVGVDLKKDPRILHAAYNDSQGVTRDFNLNLLERINRECEGTFNLDAFEHRAFYNALKGRIEMHLVSLKDQTVFLQRTPVTFRAGETIHTENSYKYAPEEFKALGEKAGWRPVKFWADPEKLFSIHYFEA